jgi:hypothetical protein
MINNFIHNYILNHEFLILISSIFLIVLISILLTRTILNFLLNQAYSKYNKLKKLIPKTKKYIKEEEELKRLKDKIPKSNSQLKAENNYKSNIEEDQQVYEIIPRHQEKDLEPEIVDIVKPIGFWTSMILGQKLTYLVQSAKILNKKGDKGFWVSMVEAKDRVAGKQHSRGR